MTQKRIANLLITVLTVTTCYFGYQYFTAPKNGAVFLPLEEAKKLQQEGKIDQAIALYKKIIYPDARMGMVHFHMGSALAQEKKIDDALRHFHNALEVEPENINALNAVGVILTQQKKPELALRYLTKALEINPLLYDLSYNTAKALMELKRYNEALPFSMNAQKINPHNVHATLLTGHIYNYLGKVDEAIAQYQKATQMDANLYNSHYNLGYTLKNKGELTQALTHLEKSFQLNPGHVDTHIARAQCLWALNDFEKCFDEYEWRWDQHGIDHEKILKDCWDGTDIKGKKIVLYCEQGLGDTLQFIRYAQLMKQKGAIVICKVQKPLVKLLETVPYIDQIITDFKQASADLKAPLMSLPRILKTSPDTIPHTVPYLKSDQNLVNLWKEKVASDKNIKIGLCWNVDPIHEADKMPASKRAIPVELFNQLSSIAGVSFYSLQKGGSTTSNTELAITSFADLDTAHGAFMDSAALIENLDLIISVDTSIAHLAGALNKNVWMLLPYAPDCRWYLNKPDTPWYPSMRIFRAQQPCDWQSAITQIAQELREFVKGKKHA